jgi:hypothetical protein
MHLKRVHGNFMSLLISPGLISAKALLPKVQIIKPSEPETGTAEKHLSGTWVRYGSEIQPTMSLDLI